MILSSRSLVAAFMACATVGSIASFAACGSSDDSTFKDGDAQASLFNEASFGSDSANYTIVTNDPPAGYCGPDAGDASTPVAIGGTADCPDDKNLPGCGCATAGQTAACWTGYRKNRGLGQCHDGTTECIATSENGNVWGPCNGEVLPNPDAGAGADGCNCFSVGIWKIANTAPCIWDDGQYYAYSTIGPNADGCTSANHLPLGQSETAVWSTDSLTTDCAGSFKLCYRIKVGDINNRQTSDCTLGESCVDVVYTTSGQEQQLPDLPAWNSTDNACAQKWEHDTPDTNSPGYGEMYVKGGETVRCDAISSVSDSNEFIFNRVTYCPKACRDGYDGGADPASIQQLCAACKLSDKGQFGH